MEKLLNFLEKNKIEFIENFDLSSISSIKLGTLARLVIFPNNTKDFVKVLTFFNQTKTVFKVLGNLSNVLFVENINFPLIVTNKMRDEISQKGRLVTVSAGVSLSAFCDFARKRGLSGIEGLAGIPATVGGALFNNAGAFGYSISDRLVSVLAFFKGQVIELKKNEIKFGYHYSNLSGFIVLSATFLFEKRKEYDIINLFNEFNYKRNLTQPTGLSLGSVYRKINDKSAGFYIERAGLKGLKIGDLEVSKKHANFFVNEKNGSVSDFLRLQSVVESEVLRQFGLTLTPEIEKVGNKNETYCRPSYTFFIQQI